MLPKQFIMSSNLKSHNGTETMPQIPGMSKHDILVFPKVQIVPAIPTSLLESKPGIQPALTHPRLSLRLGKFWLLVQLDCQKSLGLWGLGSPQSQTCCVVLEPLFGMRGSCCDSVTEIKKRNQANTQKKAMHCCPFSLPVFPFHKWSAAITVPLKPSRPSAVVSLLQQEFQPSVLQVGEGSWCGMGEVCPVSDAGGSFSLGTFFRQECLQGPWSRGNISGPAEMHNNHSQCPWPQGWRDIAMESEPGTVSGDKTPLAYAQPCCLHKHPAGVV